MTKPNDNVVILDSDYVAGEETVDITFKVPTALWNFLVSTNIDYDWGGLNLTYMLLDIAKDKVIEMIYAGYTYNELSDYTLWWSEMANKLGNDEVMANGLNELANETFDLPLYSSLASDPDYDIRDSYAHDEGCAEEHRRICDALTAFLKG